MRPMSSLLARTDTESLLGKTDRRERATMDGAGTVLREGEKVCLDTVSLVLREAEDRPFRVVLHHDRVPGDLGDDRCCGDGEAKSVAVDDTDLRGVAIERH